MDYEKQAKDFLKKTGSKIEKKLIRFDLHFPDDKEKRLIYEITLSKGTRYYTFNFGESIIDSEKFLSFLFGEKDCKFISYAIEKNDPHGEWKIGRGLRRLKALSAGEKPTKEEEKFFPSDYSILACLNTYDIGTLDDFALEFGYTRPSIALRTYKAVKKEQEELKKLYSDEELDILNQIN